MITQEFLDKLNNCEIGKTVRMNFFECSDETLNEIYKRLEQHTFTREKIDLIFKYKEYKLFPGEIFEFMKEENTFIFDSDNIEECKEKFESIDASDLIDGLNERNMEDLAEIVDRLEICKLCIRNINGTVNFDDLKVKQLQLYGGSANEVDFSNLKHIESLDIISSIEFKNLEKIKKIDNLKELSIARARHEIATEEHETDISEILEMKNLESISIIGQEINEEQANMLLKCPNISKIDINKKYRYRLLQNPPITTNIEELRLVMKSKYFNRNLSILYVGNEPIPTDIFDKYSERDIKLEVTSPLVLEGNFCKEMNDEKNFHVSIDGDSYKNYTLAEILAINEKIRQIKEGISPDASDLEKTIYLYSKIGHEVEYDHSGCGENIERIQITRSLKGGLLENKAVCRGYAINFYILAKELGLECNLIGGSVYDRRRTTWRACLESD